MAAGDMNWKVFDDDTTEETDEASLSDDPNGDEEKVPLYETLGFSRDPEQRRKELDRFWEMVDEIRELDRQLRRRLEEARDDILEHERTLSPDELQRRWDAIDLEKNQQRGIDSRYSGDRHAFPIGKVIEREIRRLTDDRR